MTTSGRCPGHISLDHAGTLKVAPTKSGERKIGIIEIAAREIRTIEHLAGFLAARPVHAGRAPVKATGKSRVRCHPAQQA